MLWRQPTTARHCRHCLTQNRRDVPSLGHVKARRIRNARKWEDCARRDTSGSCLAANRQPSQGSPSAWPAAKSRMGTHSSRVRPTVPRIAARERPKCRRELHLLCAMMRAVKRDTDAELDQRFFATPTWSLAACNVSVLELKCSFKEFCSADVLSHCCCICHPSHQGWGATVGEVCDGRRGICWRAFFLLKRLYRDRE